VLVLVVFVLVDVVLQGTTKRAGQRNFAHNFGAPLRVFRSFSTPCGRSAQFLHFWGYKVLPHLAIVRFKR